MTVPALAAPMGVPPGEAMSTPVCMRPHRGPKREVMGPWTGHMKPWSDTAPRTAPPARERAAARRSRMSASRRAGHGQVVQRSPLAGHVGGHGPPVEHPAALVQPVPQRLDVLADADHGGGGLVGVALGGPGFGPAVDEVLVQLLEMVRQLGLVGL